jgi:hypothetical protein
MYAEDPQSSSSGQRSDATVVAVHRQHSVLIPTSRKAPAAASIPPPDPSRRHLTRRAKDQPKEQNPNSIPSRRPRSRKRLRANSALGSLADDDLNGQPASKKQRVTLNTRSATKITDKRPSPPDHRVPQPSPKFNFSSIPDSDRYLVNDNLQFLGHLLGVPKEDVLSMAKIHNSGKNLEQFDCDDDDACVSVWGRKVWGV